MFIVDRASDLSTFCCSSSLNFSSACFTALFSSSFAFPISSWCWWFNSCSWRRWLSNIFRSLSSCRRCASSSFAINWSQKIQSRIFPSTSIFPRLIMGWTAAPQQHKVGCLPWGKRPTLAWVKESDVFKINDDDDDEDKVDTTKTWSISISHLQGILKRCSFYQRNFFRMPLLRLPTVWDGVFLTRHHLETQKIQLCRKMWNTFSKNSQIHAIILKDHDKMDGYEHTDNPRTCLSDSACISVSIFRRLLSSRASIKLISTFKLSWIKKSTLSFFA